MSKIIFISVAFVVLLTIFVIIKVSKTIEENDIDRDAPIV